ncbi:MAG TPA: hypothetical protein DCR15_15085 [Arthrobacter bacterium]|nr:hypothetical protein [Arthrobacter sp.]
MEVLHGPCRRWADARKVEGEQYAVTGGVNAQVVLSNPALVAASGVRIPDDSTWCGRRVRQTALPTSSSIASHPCLG